MTAKLFCKTGQLAGAAFEIRGEATIGKSAESTIQLYPGLISGKHARIFYDAKTQNYFLEDLNSRNGTRLDGVRVRGKERLGKLHIITFANTFDFLFQIVDAEQQIVQPKVAPSKQVPAASPKPVPAPVPEVEEPKTQISQDFSPIPQMKLEADSKQKTIMSSDFAPLPEIKPEADAKQKTVYDDGAFVIPPIKEEKKEEGANAKAPRGQAQADDVQRTKIGIEFTPLPSFSPETDPHGASPSARPQGTAAQTAHKYLLVFEDIKGSPRTFELRDGENLVGRDASCAIAIEDGSVSRNHAVLTVKGGEVRLKDLGSKNHTYIDQQKISSEVKIKEGTHIAFGLLKGRLLRKPST